MPGVMQEWIVVCKKYNVVIKTTNNSTIYVSEEVVNKCIDDILLFKPKQKDVQQVTCNNFINELFKYI